MGHGYGPPACAVYRRPPVWFIVLFALGFLVVDVTLARDLMRRQHLVRRGTVTLAEAAVESYPNRSSHNAVRYTFAVDGSRYEGHGFATEAEATRIRLAHLAEIAYLPEGPHISALRSELTPRSLRTGAAVLCLLTLGPGLLVLAMILSRRPPTRT